MRLKFLPISVSMLTLLGAGTAQESAAQTAPASANGAEAAPASSSEDDDIVVTAQRRQERVVDVPISITVADQAQLERQQVTTINDLNRIAPSLEIQSAPGQNTGGGGSIRGIGTQTFNQGASASVGVVVDQVSQGNANISDLFDVARIEVLKGPQGTLFGLTTSAGVINITTNAPDPTKVEAQVRAQVSDKSLGGRYGNQVVQGLINLPLGSTAALRVSGLMNLRQGPGRNALNDRLDDNDRYGARARFKWDPTDTLTLNVSGDYTQGRTVGGGDFFTLTKAVPADVVRLASCGVTAEPGNSSYCTADIPVGHDKIFGGSVDLAYDAGPFTLTSISAYRGTRRSGRGPATNIYRLDPVTREIKLGAQSGLVDLYSQELRASSRSNNTFEYTVGAYISHQTSQSSPQRRVITLKPTPSVSRVIVDQAGSQNDVTDDSMAVFGEGTFHVGPRARLIAGGRYTGEKLALVGYNFGGTGLTAAGYTRRLVTDVVSYRFGGQFDISSRTMAYVTASRGYKGGQIALATDPTLLPTVLQPEIPQSYEAGLKSTLFGGLVADLSVFSTKIANLQVQQCAIDANRSLVCASTNIDGVRSRGAEINLFGRVTRGLSLNTGFIYTKITYPSGFLGTDGSDLSGRQLVNAPRYKFTLSGEYEHTVATNVQGFFAADTIWKSRTNFAPQTNASTVYPAHWIVGGRIGVRTEDSRYSIALFARNLFNVHEPVLLSSDFVSVGNAAATYGPQSFRQIGLQLDAKF